jgi:cell division protein FtsA
MSDSNIVVGLDIGTSKIAAIVGRRNRYGKIEILGYGRSDSIGVQRGVVLNIEKTVESIKQAVEEAGVKSGISIDHVYVGIAGQHIKSLQQRQSQILNKIDTEISRDDVHRLIESMYKLSVPPGEEIIHVIPQEYIIDNEEGVKDPVGMNGNRLEGNFHIITGQIAAAKNIHKCVEKANMQLEKLILEPLASAEAVLDEQEKEAGVALVDIGGGTTDIAIFQEGIIRHTAVIPLGGNAVTDDVKEGCAIIRVQAEALKVKFGSCLASENADNEIVSIPGLRGRPPKEISLKNLASIIQARMEEIIEHVYYEIRSSGYEKKLVAGIVLTGGGSLMKHVAQLTEFITGMDTRVGIPTEHMAKEVPEELINPQFSTGIGLVIKGLEDVDAGKSKPGTTQKTAKEKGGYIKKLLLGASNLFEESDS